MLFFVINVNGSATVSKFDGVHGRCHSLNDDVMCVLQVDRHPLQLALCFTLLLCLSLSILRLRPRLPARCLQGRMHRLQCRVQPLSSFWASSPVRGVMMKTMPRLMCSSDHEGSNDTNEVPETVRLMLGVFVHRHRNLLPLSEQQLVDCDMVVSICQGGFMDNCKASSSIVGIARGSVTGYKDVPADNEQSTMAQQPVHIALERDESWFQSY